MTRRPIVRVTRNLPWRRGRFSANLFTAEVGTCKAEVYRDFSRWVWKVWDRATQEDHRGGAKTQGAAKRAAQSRLARCPLTNEELEAQEAVREKVTLDPSEGHGIPEDYYSGPGLGRTRRRRARK